MEKDAKQSQSEESLVSIVIVKQEKDNWVSGSCGRYKFQAKVYENSSEYGINNGRVSKLNIWRTINSKKIEVVNYDRGWDIKPATEYDFTVFLAILFCLEDYGKNQLMKK